MKVSVVLASYNGEKYISEQIESILSQLGEDGELIVSDDGSVDGTREAIRAFADRDGRIVFTEGPKKGFVKNFEHAITYCRGDIVFFSDQDDVWRGDKVETVLKVFEAHPAVNCIRHDAEVIGEDGKILIASYNDYRKVNAKFYKNVYKNTFTGCCMAMRTDWLKKLLPVPNGIFHDAWFGCLSCYFRNAEVIPQKLIKWRRHGNTVTALRRSRSFKTIVSDRINLYRNLKKKIKSLKRGNG